MQVKMYSICSIFCLLLSCSSNVHIVRFKATKSDISGLKAGYFIVRENMHADNFSDVESSLGEGNKEEVIFGFIRNQLRFALRDSGVFSEVSRLDSLNYLADTTVTIKYVPVTIKVPTSGISLENHNDIIIIINNMEINDVVNAHFSNGFGFFPTPGVARLIAINCSFSIVARTGELLYAGEIKAGTSTDGVRITINTWHKAVNDLAGNLLKKTNFKYLNY
jgi:hypothetical protein